MRRYCLSLACAALFTFLAPHSSEAAIIQCAGPSSAGCEPIGFFSWDVDLFLGDDIFTISNSSQVSGSPATGAFSEVTVAVYPDPSLEGPALFGTIEAGDQLNLPDPLRVFFGSTQADLSFLFQSVRFEVTLADSATQVSIYATTVVPEPASLLLFASGTVMLGLARRRRRQ